MIATAIHTAQFIVYVADGPVDEVAVATAKENVPGAMVLADVLEPLYDPSISTREAAHMLGRIKTELESMVGGGVRIVVICRRHAEDLGTRSHFLASLCAS